MSFSDYLENKILDHVFGATAYTAPANIYVAVSTADPGEDGTTAAPPSGGSYARVAVANNTTNFPDAAAGAKSNGADITFPVATADWAAGADLTHVALYDHVSAGNFLGRGSIAVPKAILSGDQLVIPAGDLDITLN